MLVRLDHHQDISNSSAIRTPGPKGGCPKKALEGLPCNFQSGCQ